MIDARRLKLIHGLPTLARWRAWSIERHRIDSQPCICPDSSLHRWCYRVGCPCPRHAADSIGSDY